MFGRVLDEVIVQPAFVVHEMRRCRVTLRQCTFNQQMLVTVEDGGIGEDGGGGDAVAAQVADELQAGDVDIAPVDDSFGVAYPDDSGVLVDEEAVAVQDDRADVVILHCEGSFLVSRITTVVG